MRRLLVGLGSLALLGAGGLAAATPAAATAKHVGVVVRYANGHVSRGCAAVGGSGLQVLSRHHSVTMGAQQYSGFVLKIDGTGTTRPDNTHYWSYWHSGGGGQWRYASSGAASYTPRAGTVEGWSYVNGQNNAPKPRSYTYAALCGRFDPKAAPKPASTTPESTPPSTPESSPASTTAAPPASSAAAPPPPVRTTAAAPHRRHSARPKPKPAHASSSHTARAQPKPARSSVHGAEFKPGRKAPQLTQPDTTASDTGFPAWGTVTAVAVVAGLGVTAWLLTRRRAG